MDMENEPREGSDEGVEETNMPQVSASVSENQLCELNIGRDRTIISTSGVERPHEDAGQGEFASGVMLEERESSVSVNKEEMVEERVEMLSKISKKHHNRQHQQNLKMIMGTPDEVSKRRALEEEKNFFILQ